MNLSEGFVSFLSYGFWWKLSYHATRTGWRSLKLLKQHDMLNHRKLMKHFFAADIQSFAMMAMKPGTFLVFSVIITLAWMSYSSTSKVCFKKNLKCWTTLSFFL
jgi:hypothetical protein